MGILIKMDNLYYDASVNSYNTENSMYDNIGDINSDVNELFSKSTLTSNDLQKIVVLSDDFVDVTPNMTSNTTPSPYIITASSSYNTSYSPWKAFNGTTADTYDSWITANGITNGWIVIDLSEVTLVNFIKITSRNYSDSNKTSPKDFALQGSNDGINFDVIKVFSEPIWASNQTKEYDLDKDVSYRYYRVNVTSNNGANYTAIGDIKLIYKDIKERFNPIDKFDNFQIININDNIVTINGIKSNNELIVTQDIDMKKDVVNLINCISLNTIGNVKIAFSINNSTNWLTYNGNEFAPLSSSIPNKNYSELDEVELVQWNNAISDIELNGFTSDLFLNIDWNTFSLSTIKFAYVLSRESYSNSVEIDELSINYDARGHMRKMKKSEYDILLYDYGLQIESLIENPIIKLNALLRETIKREEADLRTPLATPVIHIVQDGTTIKINWNSIPFADYYKVYVNGICIEDSIELSSTFAIERAEGNYLFCIRAYPNDTSKYKASEFSNMETIDYMGYLASVDTVGGDYNYVAIKLGGRLFKYKVKNKYD